MKITNHKSQILKSGFTLVEVLVSVMIFSVVMTVALGALLSMSESDRRAQAMKSVINNLNFALESMSRTIRTGYNYHCGTSGDLSVPGTQDCAATPATYFAFKAGDSAGSLVAYCLDAGAVKRQIITSGSLSASCSSSNFVPLTSAEMTITNMQFIVTGAQSVTIQPKVTVLLSGSIQVSASAPPTQFNLQTSVTQRIYDQ